MPNNMPTVSSKIMRWVKNHKKQFAAKFIRESGAAPNLKHPSCIFMAGLPGAGKTEFSKSIISELDINVVRIDMDEIATMIDGYKPEDADMYRSGATALQNEIYQLCKKGYYPFIMDGTLSSRKTMSCIRSVLNKGYSVKIMYLKQNPKVAWDFTKAREKVERRGIDKNGFILSYSKTINNLLALKEYDGISVDIIEKDVDNKVGKRISITSVKMLDKYIKIDYSNDELKGLLDDR